MKGPDTAGTAGKKSKLRHNAEGSGHGNTRGQVKAVPSAPPGRKGVDDDKGRDS